MLPKARTALIKQNMLTLLATILISGISRAQGDPNHAASLKPQTAEFANAVSVGTAKLQSTIATASDYKLTKAELVWNKGKYTWRLTFKLAKLLPIDPSQMPIGVGGEIFVDIDPKTNELVIRYGE